MSENTKSVVKERRIVIPRPGNKYLSDTYRLADDGRSWKSIRKYEVGEGTVVVSALDFGKVVRFWHEREDGAAFALFFRVEGGTDLKAKLGYMIVDRTRPGVGFNIYLKDETARADAFINHEEVKPWLNEMEYAEVSDSVRKAVRIQMTGSKEKVDEKTETEIERRTALLATHIVYNTHGEDLRNALRQHLRMLETEEHALFSNFHSNDAR